MGNSNVPAVAGLVIGAGMVVLFGVFFVPAAINPAVEKTLISYEPTRCSTTPWAGDWNKSHPGENFDRLADAQQHAAILGYYEKAGIAVFDVKYRASSSPACEGCNCSAGYIIDFLTSENDAGRLRENILKSTVMVPD